jgi:hypothetical protein
MTTSFMSYKKSSKTILSINLALGLLLAPALAFADSNMQLKPLQDTTVYSNTNPSTYTNPAAANTTSAYTAANTTTTTTNGNALNNSNGGYGLTNYGNDYYNGSSTTTIQGRLVSIPKGTLLAIHTDQPITSFAAHMGDPVNATLENDVYVNDAVAIPAGSQVLGQVSSVGGAGHMGKHGVLEVRFDSVKLPDGRVIPINAHIVTKDQSGVLKGDTYAMDIAKGVGIAAGSTAVGTLMGTAAGGLLGSVGTGAVFGLGVGALGGMGYAMARKGKEVVVPAGARMSVVIDSPVTVNN